MNTPDNFSANTDAAPQLHSCGFILFRKRDSGWQFLLMRHSDRWDLPKGLQEPGETAMQTAFRELWEETSIPPEKVTVVPDFHFSNQYTVVGFDGKPTRKQLTVFWGIVAGDPVIELTEHLSYQWFDWQPPHQIEPKNVDLVLAAIERFNRFDRIETL